MTKIQIKAGVLLFFVSATPAWAYLDPGSVSLWLQGVLAAVAALVATSRFWWFRIKYLIKKLLSRGPDKNK